MDCVSLNCEPRQTFPSFLGFCQAFFTTMGKTADMYLHFDVSESFLDEPQDSKDSSQDTLFRKQPKEAELGTGAKPNHWLSKNCQRCIRDNPKPRLCDSLFGPWWRKAFMSSLTQVTSPHAADLQGQIKMEEGDGVRGSRCEWVSYNIKSIWLACTSGQCNQWLILKLGKRILTMI